MIWNKRPYFTLSENGMVCIRSEQLFVDNAYEPFKLPYL